MGRSILAAKCSQRVRGRRAQDSRRSIRLAPASVWDARSAVRDAVRLAHRPVRRCGLLTPRWLPESSFPQRFHRACRPRWQPAMVRAMPSAWPALSYQKWSATRDTLHAHTQVLGKLAARLAPPEPQLQHAALRLSARGWETLALPAPNGSGALAIALDLRSHEALAEHSDGRVRRVALAPDRPVGEVTREVLDAVRGLGGPVEIDPTPQEVSWSVPLDADDEHRLLRPRRGRLLLRRGNSRRTRPGGVPRAISWTLDSGQRLVGFVRPRSQPLLRSACRSAIERLHHAQRDGFSGGRGRLVARRCAIRASGVLCLRASGAGGVRGRNARPPRCALGGCARRVHPGLGRSPVQLRPAGVSARVCPVSIPPCMCGVRLGSCAPRQRRGNAAAHQVRCGANGRRGRRARLRDPGARRDFSITTTSGPQARTASACSSIPAAQRAKLCQATSG